MTPIASGRPRYSPPILGDRRFVTRLLVTRPSPSLLRALLLGVGLTAALGACGRRGPLEAPPPGRALPASEAAREQDQGPSTISPVGRPRGNRQPITVPKEPFLLDPIL